MSKPTIHAIAIYGRCVWEGAAIVKMDTAPRMILNSDELHKG